MKTKKIYETPDMTEVNLELTTILAASGDLGVTGELPGDHGTIIDTEDDDDGD